MMQLYLIGTCQGLTLNQTFQWNLERTCALNKTMYTCKFVKITSLLLMIAFVFLFDLLEDVGEFQI